MMIGGMELKYFDFGPTYCIYYAVCLGPDFALCVPFFLDDE